MKRGFSRQVFEKKSSNTKFHENPSNGSQVVPRGRSDMSKIVIAFRNFENSPTNFNTFDYSVIVDGGKNIHISGSNAGYTTFRGSVKSTVYPLHSPVSP